MKVAGLIGFPLAHSITPAVYAAAFAAMSIDARCEAWVTPAEDLARTVARLRGEDAMGANVTVPHKEAVLPLLDAVDSTAARIGAVNCIGREGGRLVGHNTDLYGFMGSLREAGFDPDGKAALLLGAGGAARAVAVGLLDAGVRSLALSGRSRERVLAAADALRAAVAPTAALGALLFTEPDFKAACRAADLIVNCTPVGTRHGAGEGSSPLDAGLVRPGVFIYDLVYNPPETPFLRSGRDAGAVPVGGLNMLVYQGAESLRIWTGREPPIDIMLAAADAALASHG